MKETNPNVLVFIHIPKTAGTTVRAFLREALGRDRVFWHGPNEDGFLQDVVRERGLDYFRRFAAIGGHFGFSHSDLHRLPGRKIFAAIIRCPVQRTVSHFEFVSHRPEHGLFSELTLEQALETRAAIFKVSKNLQCRRVADRETAADAFEVLESNPFILGSFEQIGLFTDCLAETFEFDKPGITWNNVQAPGYFEKHYTPRAAEIIDTITEEDRKLYERVRRAGLLTYGI